MARRKICGYTDSRGGCIALVDTGVTYCAEHERQRGWKRKTGTTRTNAPDHRARRLRVLARDGYQCRIRYPDICIGDATICDHVVALSEGGDDTDAGCQAACSPCHARKTSAEGNRARGHTVSEPPQRRG